ncbi:MAG: GNAT family N-acetyltransferase [Bacilli bacterium]|nr:GNAT family N-acetyltransferase [Bacilli bacterium]
METIKLVRPTIEYKDQIVSYRKEFLENNDSMDGTSLLRNYENTEEWLEHITRNQKKETVQKGWVPSDEYLAIRESDNRIVGMIDIRHYLNEWLLKIGGNIGYSVRKSERRKGYAKEMLRLALIKCQELGLDRVLVSCYKHNIASAKTIMANRGVLENEVEEEDGITQRYWISLKR